MNLRAMDWTKPIQPHFYYWGMLSIAALCLIAILVTGLLAGVVSAFPASYDPLLLRTLRPLHTLFSLCWLFFGIAGAAGLACSQNRTSDLLIAVGQHALYLAFLLAAAVCLLAGRFSGREYVSWPPFCSVPLLAGMLLTAVTVARGWTRLLRHSTEAAWFLMLGTILTLVGTAETHIYLWGAVSLDPGRDLAIQWHGLDTLIAGWSISLYGVGMLLLPGPGRPMRTRGLFVVAAIGILLDFGHHNYPSPQSSYLKYVAFGATMLAVVSFVRHLRGVRRTRRQGELVTDALRQVELWTLFAVATGVLMAVPHINLYTHGTYVVVGHTMGCMIGVDSYLLFAAVWAFAGVEGRGRYRALAGTSCCLAIFCAVFMGLGLARGIFRIDHEFFTWIHRVREYYVLIPVAGTALSAGLLGLAVDMLRLSFGRASAAEAFARNPAFQWRSASLRSCP